MKRTLILLLGLVLLLSACGGPQNNTPISANPYKGLDLDASASYVLGQAIIGYSDTESAAAIASRIDASVISDWKQLRIALLQLPKNISVEKASKLLANLNGVRYAVPNRVYKLEPEPQIVNTTSANLDPLGISVIGDPDFGKQWMHRQMKTEAAWALGATGKGIRIGIHDDFMDHRHPDLVDNVAYPGFYGTLAKIICPDTPHNKKGTHASSVAGTAAASANAIGGRGIAYEASLVPLPIDDPESGNLTTVGIIRSALFAALGPKPLGIKVPANCGSANPPKGRPFVDVVNMSWGSGIYNQVTKDTMDFMLGHGIVLVTSAGNTPTTAIASPAWYPGLITVAATQPNGTRTDFSNRGRHLDVAAPGEHIWVPTTRACVLNGTECKDEADYTFINGTSFSSPATAGAAALILSAVAERDASGNITKIPLDAAQVRNILTSTAQDIQNDGYDDDLGWGIVDAEAAVKKALEIKKDATKAPSAATFLQVAVSDKKTKTPLPNTGVSLIPLDKAGKPAGPVYSVQTTGNGLFRAAGNANFFAIDPGTYKIVISGPIGVVGVQPGRAAGIIKLKSGGGKLPVSLDVDLPEDSNEPNDSSAKATVVALGKTYQGIIYAASGEDKDYYALPVTAGTSYNLNVETLSGNGNLAMVVYKADGTTVIAENKKNAFTDDPAVSFKASTTETVYIKIIDENGAGSPFNAYALDIAKLAGSETEPNGTAKISDTKISDIKVSNANSVNLGSAIKAKIGAQGDVDIFAINLTKNQILVVDAETAKSGKPDTMLFLYDSSGKEVAANDDFTGRESRMSYKTAADGKYYIIVVAWDGQNPENSTSGDYLLSITELAQP